MVWFVNRRHLMPYNAVNVELSAGVIMQLFVLIRSQKKLASLLVFLVRLY